MASKPSAAMTGNATWARGIVMAIDLTTASAVEGSIKLIAAALTRAAEEAVTAFQVAIRDYVTMRADMAEQGIATEVLAGNVMKEARERAALAELQGLQDAILNYWKRPAKSQAAQPAWSKDTPTVVGQYWHRGVKSDDPVIVRVVAAGKRLLVLYPGDPLHYTLPNIDERGDSGEWAGPIPMPREA